MARPPIIRSCASCGVSGPARQMLSHRCGEKRVSGRPPAPHVCEHCGESLSAREMLSHHCPRTRDELIAWLTEHAQPHRLHGEGSVPILNGYGTWWCFVSMGRKPDGRRDRKKFTGKSKAEVEAKRDAFLRTLTMPEVDHRGLENRSVEQLRKMYRECRLLTRPTHEGGVAK